MDCSTVNNFTTVSENDVAQNLEDFSYTAHQFGLRIKIVFATLLAILFFANSRIKRRSNCQKSSRRESEEYFIQGLSLLEVVKTLTRHKFAVLPAMGQLFQKYNGAFKFGYTKKKSTLLLRPFKFTLGFYKFVLVCRVSIIQKLYTSPVTGHLFKTREIEKIVTKSLQGNLGTLKPDTWKVHRSVLARAFTHNSLQEQVKIFEEYAKKLVFTLDTSLEFHPGSQHCSKQNLVEAVTSHVHYIILQIASGKNIVGNPDETAQFFSLIKKLKQLSSYRAERLWLLFDIPWYFHPKRCELEKNRIQIESTIAKTLRAAREEANTDDDSNNDMAGKSLIELMIKAGFSDEAIFRELIMFILVSNDGLPMIFMVLLFHLALYPKIQDKCCVEIGKMFDKLHSNPNEEMCVELLTELQYLEQCINEVVRLYPVLPLPSRMLESSLTLDENTTINQGTHVVMSAYHLHRDPKYYPEPEKFDPERFSVENVKKRGKCEYMGFSEGPRNCIARKSAILETKVLASYLLYNFEAYTKNTLEKFEAELGPNRWPAVDPKIELRRRV